MNSDQIKLNLSTIRLATPTDVSAMVSLSDQKRRDYEKVQPQFWGRADNANEKQAKFFEWLLFREIHILLVAEINQQIVGFVIGQIISAPDAYEPGGMTLKIDDFCVEPAGLWGTVGSQLLQDLQDRVRQEGVVQTLVVCGHHDEPKKQFLKSLGLHVVSEWYVGEMT